tara:strand:+ start:673107 stop:673859 length:753 start_codon:yes stop_codon:yes gene_type:complete
MNNAKPHYDSVLGKIYSWMTGDFDQAVAAATESLSHLNIKPQDSVVDLGAGHGVYAVAAAKQGASVVAIEQCRLLLNELTENRATLPIEPVEDDLIDFKKHLTGATDLILCMTDTLLHLNSRSQVDAVFRSAKSTLKRGGHFLISVRDYSKATAGDRMCLLVREDKSRIQTCLLEYGSEIVTVNDIVHEHSDDGWSVLHSCYPKLRLSPTDIADIADPYGFDLVQKSEVRGMNFMTFRSCAAPFARSGAT